METIDQIGVGKLAAFFSLFVVCGTAQGMLEEVKKGSSKFLQNPTETFVISGVTFGLGSLFGAGITKLFSKKSDNKEFENNIENKIGGFPVGPPPPGLDFLSNNPKKVSTFLKVPRKQVLLALGKKETDTVPLDWFKKIQQIQKIGGNTDISSELKLKQYKMALKKFLKVSVVPEPSHLPNTLKKQCELEQNRVKLQLSKLKMNMMKLFCDASTEMPDNLVPYVKNQLKLKYQLKRLEK